jgi:putative transposase
LKYNPEIHNRRSIRLKGYDYSQVGLYFITICVQNHLYLFGKIENDEMILNDAGKMVERQWRELVNRFDQIELHEYIVMPNHFHGIVEFVGVPLVGTQNADHPLTFGRRTGRRTGQRAGHPQGDAPTVGNQNVGESVTNGHPQGDAPTEDNKNMGQPIRIGDVVGAFKSLSTNEYIWNVKQNNWQQFDKKLWQRNYYEHIIRNEKSYVQISEYIQTNPMKWQNDKYYK